MDDMDDNAIFENAVGVEKVEVQTPAPEQAAQAEAPSEQGQVRDDKGRFAKAEQPEEQPQEVQAEVHSEDKDHEGKIPSYRLREQTEAKRAAEERAALLEKSLMETQMQLRQLAQMQQQTFQPQAKPQEQPPEFWENPDAYLQHHISPIKSEFEKQIREFKLSYSKESAIARYGEDAVREADKAIQERVNAGDRVDAERILNSHNPFAALVEWHKKEQAIAKVGPDPEAWFKSEFEKRLNDPAEQAEILKRIQATAQGATRSAPVTQIPPSLSKVGGGASQPMSASDADIFNQAISR